MRSLRTVWEDVVEYVHPYAESLGEVAYLQRLHTRVTEDCLPYSRQYAYYEQSGDMKSIVTALVVELDAELTQAETE